MPSPIATPAGGSVAGTVCRATSARRERAGSRMRSASAAGPTRSPSTAPASTEASCFGSPTRISRASRRTASSRRAVIESDTIEVSSTIDDVVRQLVAAIVPEAVGAAGAPAEQPVEGRRPRLEQSRPLRLAQLERRRFLVHGFLEPRGGLPGRRGEGDERRRRSGRLGLLVEEDEDARDGGRLARAGAAADDGEAAQHAGRGGEALEVGLVSVEQPCQAVGEHGGVDVARGLVAGEEVGGDGALVAPVAVEVERRADEPERSVLPAVLAGGDQRARGEAVDPGLGFRPRQRLQVDRRLEVGGGGGADRGEVDADGSESGCAHGERGREQRVLVLLLAELREAEGDVDVGGGQHSCLVEGAQRAGGAPDVAGRRMRSTRLERAHVAAPPRSSRSLSASIERRRRPPGEDPARLPVDARRVRAGHAAKEQVEDAGEVPVRRRSRGAARGGSGAARRGRAALAAGSARAASPLRARPAGSARR